ncbi:transcription factor HES-1-like isoform X2 [Scleropages formosus]|uniref:transcription factor HES-1-like isoform X2 n=1 Tax=Scleropages formosus TaxID=113540 RepID=UPI0010FAA16F|nr:transcription factor HES-1-like isoform X2 [Scleropages formosus]
MGGGRPRAVFLLPPPSGRVSAAPIGPKLLWERKFGKFHTSRSRAASSINRSAAARAFGHFVSLASGEQLVPHTPRPTRLVTRTLVRDRRERRSVLCLFFLFFFFFKKKRKKEIRQWSLFHKGSRDTDLHVGSQGSLETKTDLQRFSLWRGPLLIIIIIIITIRRRIFTSPPVPVSFCHPRVDLFQKKIMPADLMEKNSSSPVAATPASASTGASPDKPRTASEHRKSSKPIMEKRRRARINESLGQLKTLILDALKKDSSRHSKLEKADILEMTVKHLRNLQRAQMTALNTDPSVLGKYRAGFSECVGEVTRFLSTCEGVSTEVTTRLLGHLAGCMSQINAVNYPAQHQVTAAPPHPGYAQPMVQVAGATPPLGGVPCKGGPAAGLSPEAVKLYGGFQIVPATDRQVAFLIPNTAFAPSGALVPVFAKTGGAPVPASAPMSPCVPPGTSDSVWRPW